MGPLPFPFFHTRIEGSFCFCVKYLTETLRQFKQSLWEENLPQTVYKDTEHYNGDEGFNFFFYVKSNV